MLSQNRYRVLLALLISVAASFYVLTCPSNCKCNCDTKECSVDCSGMSLDKINFTQFKELPSIPLNIKLQNCQLKQVPKELQGLNIKSLDLSQNQIKVIENEEISKFKALENLDLSDNSLDMISIQSSSLKTLKLSQNDIKSISKFTFECQQLTDLDMSHNKIRNIPEGILPDKLETLSVANNR